MKCTLVNIDTEPAEDMAKTIRQELNPSIIIDETMNAMSSYNLATQIRENDVNILLIIGVSQDTSRLWSAMQEADANVDAWIILGQDSFTLVMSRNQDMDTTGIITISSQHVATGNIEQVLGTSLHEQFLEQYQTINDNSPSIQALSAMIGTHYLLYEILSSIQSNWTNQEIRTAFMNTSQSDFGLLSNEIPLIVRQQQSAGACLLMPVRLATCNQPLQPFPTWRERILNNQ